MNRANHESDIMLPMLGPAVVSLLFLAVLNRLTGGKLSVEALNKNTIRRVLLFWQVVGILLMMAFFGAIVFFMVSKGGVI